MEIQRRSVLLTMPQAWEHHLGRTLQILETNEIKVELVWSDGNLDRDSLVHLLARKSAYLVSLDRVDQSVIAACPDLRIIAKHGIGLDNIDVQAATAAHILVCNTPGSNSHSVADLTIGMIVSLCRGMTASDASVRQGKLMQAMGTELFGKRIGIIGFGAIGKQVALRAKGFGMQVSAYDTFIDREFCRLNGIESLELSVLLEISDIVTLHVPLTDQTRGMLNTDSIAKMKRGALLVNMARGGIIDEDACADALISGQLSAAGFDVLSSEPPQVTAKLFTAPNTLFTSHTGGTTKEAIARTAEIAAGNIVEALSGKGIPKNCVNCSQIRDNWN